MALALIEPSMADATAAIEAAEDLPEDKRRHWACSLRVIAKALGKPLELVPARWTAVRLPLSRLHHAQMGVTAKTLANHKANVRAALNWFAKEAERPFARRSAQRGLGQAQPGHPRLPHPRQSVVADAILFGLRHRPRGGE